MIKALDAVKKDKLTVSKAAALNHVPRKTLDDRVRCRVVHGRKPGRTTVLTSEEEEALCNYLIYMAERGFPLTRRMVMAYAWAVARRSGKEKAFNKEAGPGDRWWSNFRRRHPKITLRKLDKLDRNRAQNFNPEVVDKYFKLLKKTLEDNSLMTSPRRIYNCDESFLPLDGSREKAVTYVKSKCAYGQVTGTTEHITLLCGASAAGIALPPMIIYPKAFPGGAYTFKGPDDAVYAKSESGWVDSELFLSWMKKIFLVHAVPQRPVLLLIDGHKSHLTLELIDLARANDVILLCLPPHTTHALQPLDVSVFKSLKDQFYKSLRAFCFLKKNFVVSKKEFASVVKDPFEKAFSMSSIKAGFKKCGIFPFNPGAIDRSKMLPSELYSPLSSSALNTSSETSQGERSSNSALPSSSTIAPPMGECSSNSTPPTTLPPTGECSSNSTPPTTLPPAGECSSSSPATTVDADTSVPESSQSFSEVSIIPETPTSITVTPPLTSTPTSSEASFENPLVAAGLVPSHLADIFSTPHDDPESRPKRRRITDARVLTENEYYDLLKAKERKEKEEEELKQQRKEERERRKKEKEEEKERRKKEREEEKERKKKRKEEERMNKKRKGVEARRKGKGVSRKGKDKACTSSELESEHEDTSSRPRSQRVHTLPARFRENTDSGSDESDDGILCALCNAREPEGFSGSTVFWVDCDKCGTWVHTYCANNSSKYVCSSCA